MDNLQSRSHETIKGCLSTIESTKGHEINDMLEELAITDFQRFKNKFKLEEIVDFEITGIKNYGVFGKVANCPGLMHKSNIPKKYHDDLNKYFQINDTIKIRIKSIDTNKERFEAVFVSFD